MKNEYIRIQHISKEFHSTVVLKDLNAVLHKGEILGFLGPSGAGKTTTIKILTGQLKLTKGDAYVLDIHCDNIDETIYEQIGIVTDNSGIYERMSVYDNLKYFSKILNVSKERIDVLLKRVGLFEHKMKLASQLSKGQKQRLILARAILHTPKILFLDEPTSGLDPSTALTIHNLLLELKHEGMAIFLTTHNMEEATKLCDHVALLNEGVIVEYGSPKELCIKHNQEKKYKVILNDDSEHILSNKANDIEKMRQWLLEDKVEALHSCEPTLEDVFIHVTGRGLN
ncbi:ABC transporter ATP-binding protein [Amedibacterium intestinale]|uniref:ABC transporter ATP-binding protein n=1 Tax=Amedibacterium intestinale TaxID=2583452 RepID=A0A6N4TDY9_9FIRM|nr:ABC transporter ATP-binding protein [Amedibacterium intestinale]BBK21376.1 ABC transporter ATP-binding protein [Amedibacterium intestinale]BBK61448.1 ABC transporter ATP-binding protein [Amedibacterium intestinale]